MSEPLPDYGDESDDDDMEEEDMRLKQVQMLQKTGTRYSSVVNIIMYSKLKHHSKMYILFLKSHSVRIARRRKDYLCFLACIMHGHMNVFIHVIIDCTLCFRLGISYKDNQFGATSRILDTTKNRGNADVNILAKSAKIINEGMRANGRTVTSYDREEQIRKVQDEYRKEKDKYIDRPLPPVRRRFNFGPGREQIGKKWKNMLDR